MGHLMFSKSWQDWSPIIIVAPFFHLPSLLVSRSLVSQSNLSGSCFFSRCWIKNAIKFLYSFKKQLTFFYKVVENGDFAIAINFALLINISYVDISNFVEITVGMNSYFIVPDCASYTIYILTYACIFGVIIGKGVVVICTVFIIKVFVYEIFTKK